MHKYLIERTVAGAGQMDAAALAAIAKQSNKVLRDLGPDIQWVHSYVTDDKITCVYLAASEEIVREHGRCGGFPVDAVHEVRAVIDPTTAEVADEPGRDQPDHRPRGSGEGDRRPAGGGRRRRGRPGHPHVPDQGGGSPGHRRRRPRGGVRRLPAHPGPDEALRGRRRRAARLPDLLQRQEAWTKRTLVSNARLGGTVQLWEWIGDGATTFSY